MISRNKGRSMALRDASRSSAVSLSLGEAATQFLLSLPPEERPKSQQEVYRFVIWYGEKRLVDSLTIPEVASYAEQITSLITDPASKLQIVKAFLSFAYDSGLTKIKLATHLKIKKAVSKARPGVRRYSHKEVALTPGGYATLEAELEALKSERPTVADELRKAAADKDFRENAPLEAMREYQGQLEARIRELESTLKAATVVEDKQANGDKVGIHDWVLLSDLSSGEQLYYTLVDQSEAKVSEGKISVTSPIGRALLGSEKGQAIEVKAPAGVLRYRVEEIRRG